MGLFQGKKKKSEDRRDKKKNGLEEKPIADRRRMPEMIVAARAQEKIASPVQSTGAENNSSTSAAIHGSTAHSSPQVEAPQRFQELPDGYGDNLIYLMVRDPYWLYSYWEIQKDYHESKLKELGGNWNEVNAILRVHDVTDTNHQTFFDIYLHGLIKNWYVNVQPNRSYYIEIGLLHRDGRYRVLACSNQITTPRSGMSEVIDEHWMGIDFDKMYALSGGFQVGKSSMELQKLMEERLMGAISSGSGAGLISSMASPVKKMAGKQRSFWFVLDCELIVYGATEPDARVTLQGREIKLRPDGTFSLRFALPDGHYVLDAHAYSADEIEERAIIPIVTRETKRPAPVLKS